MHRGIDSIFYLIIDGLGVCFYLVSILLSVNPSNISEDIGLFSLIPNTLYFWLKVEEAFTTLFS